MTFTKSFLLLVIALCTVTSATAVGISIPPEYSWEFQPGFERRVEFRVYNGHDFPLTVAVQLGGDLLPYGNVSETSFPMAPNGISTFFVYLKAPQTLEGGEHRLEITAIEQPIPGSSVTASTAVTVFLQLTVPYEGKFMRAKLTVPPTADNDSMRPFVEISNLGKVDIIDAHANITVMDGPVLKGSFQTDHAGIPANGHAVINATWAHDLKPGLYQANAVIFGDENVTTSSAPAIVGVRDVELLEVTTDLLSGQVNPVRFTLLNNWNARFDGVRATIYAGPTPRKGWKAAGPEFSMWPWQPTENEFYMNVPDVPAGTYPGIIEVKFEGITKTFERTFIVRAPSAPLIESPAAADSGLLLPRVFIIILLIVIIAMYLRARRRERRSHA